MSHDIHYANPPILIENLIEDLDEVAALFARAAPYTPLGGWFMPDGGSGEAKSAMWFQNDWVHADFAVEGSGLFLHNEKIIQAAKDFYDAEVVVPKSIYVNLMAAIAEGGPAHTDNPVFRGRNRSNTPMMLLRSMLWSGLFDRWIITQATSIWWYNDTEGGGLRFWPNGPAQQPERHVGNMANTALVGDNHGMFHQVEPVGPFDQGTVYVSASAELAPAEDGSGDWVVSESGREVYRAPFDQYRASVLWKADVYTTEAERIETADDLLSEQQVVDIFNRDLASRDISFALDIEKLEDPQHIGELGQHYPEAIPVGACKSMFEV